MSNLAHGHRFYIRSMGKSLPVTGVFLSEKTARGWTVKHQDQVVVAALAGVLVIASAHAHSVAALPANPVPADDPGNMLSGNTLYLASDGKAVRITGMFDSDRAANHWMETHTRDGHVQSVILNIPPLVFCADSAAKEIPLSLKETT